MAVLNKSALNQAIKSFGKPEDNYENILDNYDKSPKPPSKLNIKRTWDSVPQVRDIQHTKSYSMHQGGILSEHIKRGLLRKGLKVDSPTSEIKSFGSDVTIKPHPYLSGSSGVQSVYSGGDFDKNKDGSVSLKSMRVHSSSVPHINGDPIRGSYLKGLRQLKVLPDKQ